MIENHQPLTACELSRVLKRLKLIDRSHTTINRWMRVGVRGVVLASRFIGGYRCTSLADYEQFDRELNAGASE